MKTHLFKTIFSSLFLLISIPAMAEKVALKVNSGAWHAIASASPVVQLTLLILVIMSVVSWAIIFSKRKQFQQITAANEPFSDEFWRAASLDEVFTHVDDYPSSTMANVFRSGYLELRKMADSSLAQETEGDSAPLLSGIDNLERSLRKAMDNEISIMEGRLSFLATTGSTGPFIGLFGTVWGIMGTFQNIANTGMASLAVVAPGISEALIATGVGLAAAIPATVSYNNFLSDLKRQELDLNNFSADFLNIVKRNFFKDN